MMFNACRKWPLILLVVLATQSTAFGQNRYASWPKGYVEIDGAFLANSDTLTDTATPTINAESAQITTTYDVPATFGFSGGFGYRIWRNLAAGVSFARYAGSVDASVTGAIPHPFTFAQLRHFEGAVTGLDRSEMSFGLQARGLFPVSNKLTLTLFGGPVYSSLSQDVISSITYTEAYPYDTVTFQSQASETQDESRWGIGAGADAAYFFTR